MVNSKHIYIHLDNLMSLNLQSLHKAQLSDKTRFADGLATNPEEIIVTALAGCFSMQVGFFIKRSWFYCRKYRH